MFIPFGGVFPWDIITGELPNYFLTGKMIGLIVFWLLSLVVFFNGNHSLLILHQGDNGPSGIFIWKCHKLYLLM